MLSQRSLSLLAGCAQDLLNGTPPLNHQFLVDHAVTCDECMQMSELLGALVIGVLVMPEEVRDSVVMAGRAANGKIDDSARSVAARIYGSAVMRKFHQDFLKKPS